MSPKGVPDIIGIHDSPTECPHCHKTFKTPKPLYMEIKTARGKVTEHQARFLTGAYHAGATTLIARSVQDVIKGLGIQEKFKRG